MKKLLKVFIVVFLSMFILNTVYAELSSVSESDCDKYKDERAKKSCHNIWQHCYKDKPTGGCIYDPNDEKYTKVKDKESCYGNNCLKMSGSLTRAYQAVNSDGKAVFAGCYKVNYGGNGSNGKGKGVFWGEAAKTRFEKGTYFVFKIITPQNDCKEKSDWIDIVPPDKVDGYDGQNAVGSPDVATYNGWRAKQGGECPLQFGLSANTSIFTAKRREHIFGNDVDDLNTSLHILFWDVKDYVAVVGCTVYDEKGYTEALNCYDENIEKIRNTKCPSSLNDTDKLRGVLDGLANRCSSQFEVMYKASYLEENSKTFQAELNKAVNEKYTSCQYAQCGLTDTEIYNLTNKLASSPYKDGCIGKTGVDYDSCLASLKKTFESSGLSATKVNCLYQTQRIKDTSVSIIEGQISEDQQKHIEEELEEAKRAMIAHIAGLAPKAPDKFDIDDKHASCAEVIGEGLLKIIKAAIKIIQIAAAAISIVRGMMILLPALIAKDSDAIKKSIGTLVKLSIVLVIVFLFPTILKIVGKIVGFDLSCL